MATDLPLPPEQYFYADDFLNPQIQPITRFIDYVHYPTLGCPALLGPREPLQVLASLPLATDPLSLTFRLVDRHGLQNAGSELLRLDNPSKVAVGPDGKRQLFHYRLQMAGVPFALFDLHVVFDGQEEIQYNAVRHYQAITGTEQVIVCGDSQFHVDNRICLERFIEKVNTLDVAWIALIGDVCDNDVKGPINMIKLAAQAQAGPVTNYYQREYIRVHELLRTLRHPILLVPGNHDGMSANVEYDDGEPSEVFLGPDPLNAVEYDGLHHFRCTLGPLFFRQDWANTRYLFTNSFELTRPQRLGYHAVVVNWGGWMRPEQLDWIRREMQSVEPKKLVMCLHHDPRGGSMGVALGYYHQIRPYSFDRRFQALKSFLSYALKQGRRTWQQEWMAPAQLGIDDHPVRKLLGLMLEHRVWAVCMGHDNENWIDSYRPGNDIFALKPSHIPFVTRTDVGNDVLVNDIIESLDHDDYPRLLAQLEAEPRESGEAALSVALAEIDARQRPTGIVFAPKTANQWGLQVKSAIHFIHTDDVGAYKYSRESDFRNYGYVLAILQDGAPVRVQSYRLNGTVGPAIDLQP